MAEDEQKGLLKELQLMNSSPAGQGALMVDKLVLQTSHNTREELGVEEEPEEFSRQMRNLWFDYFFLNSHLTDFYSHTIKFTIFKYVIHCFQSIHSCAMNTLSFNFIALASLQTNPTTINSPYSSHSCINTYLFSVSLDFAYSGSFI